MVDKQVNDGDISTLREENPHELVEDFASRFRQAIDLKFKKTIIRQMVKKLEKIAHQSESAQDLYDVAESFYFAGNLVEQFDDWAVHLYQDSLKTWQKLLKSPHLLGKFYDIAEIHVNIAKIFGEKLGNRLEEHVHLHEAIILFVQEAQLILTLGNATRAAQVYFIVGDLYGRVEDWDAATQAFKIAGELAKALHNSRLLFNVTESLGGIYHKFKQEEEAIALLQDTVETLLNEAETPQDSNNEVMMAEIYQFIKKLRLSMGEVEESEYFAKKESAEYIHLAKQAIKDNNLPKAGALYRDAGLCFRDIAQYVDAGSCFHLSANMYKNVSQFVIAAENYLDAAYTFEKAKNLPKAVDLLTEAGNCYIDVGNYESAMDVLSAAFDFLEGMPGAENSDSKTQLGHKVAIVFSQVAQLRADKGNHSASGTLFLEAAVFLRRVNADWDTFILPQLRQSMHNFWFAFQKIIHNDPQNPSAALLGVLAAAGGLVTGERDIPERVQLKLTTNLQLPMREMAIEFLQALSKCEEDRTQDLITQLGDDAREIYDQSPELKKLSLFFEEKISELT